MTAGRNRMLGHERLLPRSPFALRMNAFGYTQCKGSVSRQR